MSQQVRACAVAPPWSWTSTVSSSMWDRERTGAWYDRLWEDLGVDPERLHEEFFRQKWHRIVSGRTDLREELAPVLKRINPAVPVDELTSYWFRTHSYIDRDVLDAVTHWADRTGGRLFLATNQEKYRAGYLWRDLGLRSVFEDIFYSAAMRVTKSDVGFFEQVGRAIAGPDYRDADILFFDDDTRNVEVARRASWEAHLFTDVSALREILHQWPSPDLRAPAGSTLGSERDGARVR